VTPHSVVVGYQRFRGLWWVHLHPETLVCYLNTIWHQNPQDLNLKHQCCKSLKTCQKIVFISTRCIVLSMSYVLNSSKGSFTGRLVDFDQGTVLFGTSANPFEAHIKIVNLLYNTYLLTNQPSN